MKRNQNFDHNHSQKVFSCRYNMDINRVEARFEDVEIFQYNKVQLRGGLCLAPSEKNYSELKQKYLHWRGKSRWML